MVGMCFGHQKKLVDEGQGVPYTDGDRFTTNDDASAIPTTSEAPRQIDPQHFLLLGDHRSPDYDWSGRFTKPTFTSEELRERLETVQYERHLGFNFTAEHLGGEPPDSGCDAVSTGYDYTRDLADLADLAWHDLGENTLCELVPPGYLEEQPSGQDSQVVVTVTELTDDSFNDKVKIEAKAFPFERRAVTSSSARASLLSARGPCLIELAEYEPVGVEESDPLTGTIRGGAGSPEPDDSSEDAAGASRLNASAPPFQPVSRSSSSFLDAQMLPCMKTDTHKPIPPQANQLNQPSGVPTSIPVSVPGSPRRQQSVVTPGRMLWLYGAAKGPPYSKNRIPTFHPKATHGRMFPEWIISWSPSQPVDTPSLRGGCFSDAEEEYDQDDCEPDTDGGVVHGSSSQDAADRSVNEITLAMKPLEKKLSTVEAMVSVRPVLSSNGQIDLEDSFIANLFANEEVDAAILLPRTAAGVPISKSDSEDGRGTKLFTESAADRLVNETPLAMKLPLPEADSEYEHDNELLPDANQVRGKRLNPAADEFVPTAATSIPTPPDYVDAITTTLPTGLRYFDLTRRARYTGDDTELPSYEECSHSTAPPYTRYHVEPVTLEQARGARTSVVNILGRYRGQILSSMSTSSSLREIKFHLGTLQDFQSAAELVNAYHASVPPIPDVGVENMWQVSGSQSASLAMRQVRQTESWCGECETCRENQEEEEVWYYCTWNGKSAAVSWAGEAVQADDATWRSRSMQRRCYRLRRLARESWISRRVSSVVRSRAVEEVDLVVMEHTVDDYLSQPPVEAASGYPTQDSIMQEVNDEVYYFDAREAEDVWRERAAPAWTCSSREMGGQDLVGRLEELD